MARVPALLIVSLLSASAAFAQSAPPTQASIRAVMNRVHGYLLTAAPLRPVDATTGAAVSLSSMPKNVALGPTTLRIDSYEWGVTYAGMMQATEFPGGRDPRFRAYVITNLSGLARMAAHMRANYPDATADNFPPALSGTYSLRRVLFPRIPDEAGAQCSALIKARRAPGIANLRPLIDIYANWMSKVQYRLSDGTLARNTPMPNTVWLDDLYMGVPCFAQMALLTGDSRYFDDAIKQVLQFHSKMFVPQKGLYMHGWVQEMSPHPVFHWARANGWALMATAELLTVLPRDHPQRAQILNIFKAHAAGLRRVQAPSGLWHQLLDRPDSYEETSSSAMFVFALTRAINKGWLSRSTWTPIVLRGWNGLKTKVNSIGQVEGTCIGTGLGWDDTFYLNRPRDVNAAHGYGPIFLAGSELDYMLETQLKVSTTNATLQFEPAFED
jgi:unsaturated rhamnogalacturonyl hydrolase